MENNKDYKEHLAAVRFWGSVGLFIFVPKELKSPELCELAVKSHGFALAYVPKELRTPELCELAIKGVLGQGGNLQFAPYELRTQELCEIAVKDKGYALEHVPEELKTLEMCEYAVSRDGYNLEFVPNEFRTFQICDVALQNVFKGRVDKVLNAFVPEEFHKELAEKYDIELIEKTDERGR